MVQKLTEKQGNDWRVPTTLARYNFILKNHHQAALHLDKSLMIRQDLPGVWVLRGINYMRMDSLQLALDNFIQALAKYPDDPEMNYYTGFSITSSASSAKRCPFCARQSKLIHKTCKPCSLWPAPTMNCASSINQRRSMKESWQSIRRPRSSSTISPNT
jgi:hypothetical protein